MVNGKTSLESFTLLLYKAYRRNFFFGTFAKKTK